MGPADYLIVAGYFVVMLGIGVFFSGRMRTLRDFFGGGSAVPVPLFYERGVRTTAHTQNDVARTLDVAADALNAFAE